MAGLSLSLGLGLTRARGAGAAAASAYQQLLDLATADGWTALYDPTNPDTRTLRDDGTNKYFSANADGRASWTDVQQTTAADQPILRAGYFGELDGMEDSGTAASGLVSAAANANLAQPVTVVTVVDNVGGSTDDFIFSKNDGTSGAFDAFISNDTDFKFRSPTEVTTVTSGLRTNKLIVGVVYDGISSKAFVNSADIGGGDSGTDPFPTEFKLMNLGSIRLFEGKMGPFIVGQNITAGKRTAMFDELHDLTGIPKA